MTPEEYQAFTASLVHSLEQDRRVLGLLAVGSMAGDRHQPDQWSDHDFLVIVESGQQEWFRTTLTWLPGHDQIVLNLRETAHGLKIVYSSGHLIEFAVFDMQELYLAKINSCRVLIDRADITGHVEQVRAATEVWSREQRRSDEYLVGQFLTQLLVGAGRYARGERLSAHFFVKQRALEYLVRLIVNHIEPGQDVLDNIDPVRRFEAAYPEIGAEINRLLLLETPLAAQGLLELAESRLPDYLLDGHTVSVIQAKIHH